MTEHPSHCCNALLAARVRKCTTVCVCCVCVVLCVCVCVCLCVCLCVCVGSLELHLSCLLTSLHAVVRQMGNATLLVYLVLATAAGSPALARALSLSRALSRSVKEEAMCVDRADALAASVEKQSLR